MARGVCRQSVCNGCILGNGLILGSLLAKFERWCARGTFSDLELNGKGRKMFILNRKLVIS